MVEGLLLFSAVVILCVLGSKISEKIGMPGLLLFILLGMLFGSDGVFKIDFGNFAFAEIISSIALIIIIFYGGFGTSWRSAKTVAAPALLLSSAGVLITAGVTGVLCHFILGFSWLEAFLIGSILGSTDAASVFSILRSKKLNLKYGTASLLELESGSNDPWAYMLTTIFLGIMQGNATSAPEIARLLLFQIAFGAIGGVVIALIALVCFRKLNICDSTYGGIFLIAVALLAYAVPAYFGGNGYLSAYIVGIVLGNSRLRHKVGMVHFFDGITNLVQILVFFLLGLLSFPSQIPKIIIPAVGVFLFITLVARPIATVLCLTPFKAPWRQQFISAFCGLRGATSIIFAIVAVVNPAKTDNDLFHITFCVVLLSIGLQGSLLPWVSKKIKMTDDNENVMKTFNDYIEETQIQFLKLPIGEKHRWIGKSIKNIHLPPSSRVAMIVRNKLKVLPRGNTIIEDGDMLILSAPEYHDDTGIILNEIILEDDHPWCNKAISDIDWENSMAVLITRKGKTIVPNGNLTFKSGDVVVTADGEEDD